MECTCWRCVCELFTWDKHITSSCLLIGNISISGLTYDRDTQFLVCTSTGGPATTVTWTKDKLTLSIDGTLYQQTQVITDMTESVYENRLRIINQASISSGLYSCTVTNDRGSATSELYISGKIPLTHKCINSYYYCGIRSVIGVLMSCIVNSHLFTLLHMCTH